MYCYRTLKDLNCNHNINLYFEGKFIKEDYCNNCLDLISEIEQSDD